MAKDSGIILILSEETNQPLQKTQSMNISSSNTIIALLICNLILYKDICHDVGNVKYENPS